jgi:hypothetical protein
MYDANRPEMWNGIYGEEAKDIAENEAERWEERREEVAREGGCARAGKEWGKACYVGRGPRERTSRLSAARMDDAARIERRRRDELLQVVRPLRRVSPTRDWIMRLVRGGKGEDGQRDRGRGIRRR